MPKATGTLYPMTQIPPGKNKLDVFQWFDYVRPLDKNDVFNWRGKAKGTEIKTIERHAAPLQYLSGDGRVEKRPLRRGSRRGLQALPPLKSRPPRTVRVCQEQCRKEERQEVMNLLFQTRKPRRFHHEPIYYSEREDG